jgi:hypothetical protein
VKRSEESVLPVFRTFKYITSLKSKFLKAIKEYLFINHKLGAVSGLLILEDRRS